jgi:hypothetical protein
VVVIVSTDWHDAIIAANLAQRNGAQVRFVQDLPQLQSLVEELEAPDSGTDTAIVLAKQGSELPSLSYRLRSTNLDLVDSRSEPLIELTDPPFVDDDRTEVSKRPKRAS